MSQPFRIAIAGLGTVGGGVVALLRQNAALVALRAGRPVEIRAVSAKNRTKDRGVDLSGLEWADDPRALYVRPDVDTVVELIGGESGAAHDVVAGALGAGKHVVTANKALLARHGVALARLAEEKKVSLACEAAVAGGIPIIKVLREGLAGNNIVSLYGILNGTCNYILTEMRTSGRDFDAVLKEAQDKGYAEADPSFDVDGIDAGHKLSLLAAMALGAAPDVSSLPMTGIRAITAQDIVFSGDLGFRIKLLGRVQIVNGKMAQSVEPCLVPTQSPLGGVDGVYNAVFYHTDFAGAGMISGRGAGAGPTASAVVSDIVDLARGLSIPAFGVPAASLRVPVRADSNEITSRFYMHLRVRDQAGVIADVSAIMRDHRISIESLIQRGRDPGQPVSVVMVTHETSRADMDAAQAKIEKLASMTGRPLTLRIEDIA
jgi:homoserine dehydrogenase